MKALIQRVTQAHVLIDQKEIARIQAGMLVLVCAEPTDQRATADLLIEKLCKLRIFADAEGKMNLNIKQAQGELLLVSQFTLAADTRRGTRPGFSRAAPPELAKPLFEYLIEQARGHITKVEHGIFAADMQVHLVNDGPVTIPLDIN
ncbi:D-aminoacyl-tRNA deacylase [Alcaligenes endophyticus]|uniref:D-aminoacyl-tRNA deacylase n=1 Tax=Alcaligenes endophyticus TaxID=1929088 RepID=A0ABT8EIH0_9BURK|nr:D-aminoacyl-tRNA deacylase [Alcaligenes endophyticus]MCX5592561.1 D-aminoacyl-tRNA deacylase [Alcaligenes endophyticus]MDN4121091.1 D-tyrosyl-tRNA(Tyr) deacylase [Alcaligenes endophyticus]